MKLDQSHRDPIFRKKGTPMAHVTVFYTPEADPFTTDRRKELYDEKNKKKATPLERYAGAFADRSLHPARLFRRYPGGDC